MIKNLKLHGAIREKVHCGEKTANTDKNHAETLQQMSIYNYLPRQNILKWTNIRAFLLDKRLCTCYNTIVIKDIRIKRKEGVICACLRQNAAA